MLQKALILTLITEVGMALMLLHRLKFLRPFRWLLFHNHGLDIAIFFAVLAINLLAVYSVALNRFHLTGVGDKLPLSKQDIEAEG